MDEHDEPHVDAGNAAGLEHPDARAGYDALRSRCPVVEQAGVWLVLGHREVVAAATDPVSFSSSVTARRAIPNSLDGKEHAAFPFRKAELGIGEDPHELARGGLARERAAASGLPRESHRGEHALAEHEGREDHVRVQDDAERPGHALRLRAGFRAQATAPAISFSPMPSCASFSRTASALWIRAGVRMMRPSFASTWK